ncbi:unnamed protein product [Arctia plantaginis]|uniref:Uncharacterized protein n=1 Tax=Arctia plantaginis TaxID=874455 RepID=A0A8S1A743_ARCPL|nr:unnamed protein product [Arctia plantaginis]
MKWVYFVRFARFVRALCGRAGRVSRQTHMLRLFWAGGDERSAGIERTRSRSGGRRLSIHCYQTPRRARYANAHDKLFRKS